MNLSFSREQFFEVFTRYNEGWLAGAWLAFDARPRARAA